MPIPTEKVDVSKYVEALKANTHLGTNSPFHFTDDPLAIEVEFGEMLMNEVAKSKPKVIVEIGMGHGYSTTWLVLGQVDHWPNLIETWDVEERHPKIWKTLGLNGEIIPMGLHWNIEPFSEKSTYLPEKVDFVFHDSQHRFELITPDLEKVIPRMTEKGQIWIHDANGELGRQLKKWFEDQGWRYEGIEESCGMGIARR